MTREGAGVSKPKRPAPLALPDGIDWPEQTREWWDAWITTPGVAAWGATDWQDLLNAALLHADVWGGNIDRIKELRAAELSLRTRITRAGGHKVPHSWATTELDQLRTMHAEGASLSSIAEALHRSKGGVSHRAKALGLTFDRTGTAVATRARVIDARARAAAALERELELLELSQKRLLDVYHGAAQHTTMTRGEGGGERITNLPFVPPGDERALANARAASASVVRNLTERATDPASEVARSLLGSIAEGLGLAPADE